MWEKRNAYRIMGESQKERDHWEDQDASGSIILKLILERQDGIIWTRLMWIKIGTFGFHKMLVNS
jgi:hypothetical protein